MKSMKWRAVLIAVLFPACCLLASEANAAVCDTVGERTAASTWFRQLNRAWEHLDAAAATAMFTQDAEYRDDPFEAPLRGAKAIRAYWDDVARGQRAVHTDFEVLSACGRKGIVHWQASFVRVPSGQKVRLDGIAEVTLDKHGKCVLFREWWNREQQ